MFDGSHHMHMFDGRRLVISIGGIIPATLWCTVRLPCVLIRLEHADGTLTQVMMGDE